jgi:glycosyltransferase involved in cell wall biosynthesis
MKLAICIPCYNESNYIAKTLQSISLQEDRDFKVFVCDNGSTDTTASIAATTASTLGLDLEVVHEGEKGTGSASDTAFRTAISQGFDLIARTDADAIVDRLWTKGIRKHFRKHPHGMASGITVPIADELTRGRYLVLRAASLLAATFGLLRPSNYGAGRRGRYVMTNGNNLAIDRQSYLSAGGFRKSKIEELHEDRALVNDLRSRGGKVYRVRSMRVQVSARRINAWGLANSLKWYASHSFQGNEIDIR